ncbi:MAG: cardiolipin synthase ClsB [Pseudomonadota bacterium]
MSRYVKGNQVTLLRNGTDYFPALLSEIQAALHEIHIQTYIYEADDIGRQVGDALILAAQRGVNVCLLMDGFGSKELPPSYVEELEKGGVQVLVFRPQISPWTFKSNRLRRLHRKVSVFDGRVAFVGGINIIDDLNVPGNNGPRIDYAVRIEGVMVPDILTRVQRLWRHISWRHLQSTQHQYQPVPMPPVPGNSMLAKYVVRDNILHRRDIEQMYMQGIRQAKKDILIANAYFIPGVAFRNALIDAAKRGVRVRLLLQGRREHMLMIATHALYSNFLRNDIEIYEYRKSFMHSKVAVIDGNWATVGSSNIDPFSLLLSREANVFVKNGKFAAELRGCIEQDIEHGAVQVLARDWEHGHVLKRTVSWLVFILVRFVLGLIGYPNRH